MDVQVKRVYEAPEESDGFRILTDRLWPRGISKEKAALGIWDKSIAHRRSLGNGSAMIRKNSRSSRKDMRKNFREIRIRRSSFPLSGKNFKRAL